MKQLNRGKTAITRITERWSKEELERNDKIEATLIHTGRMEARQLVCTMNPMHPEYEQYAKLIIAATDLLEALQEVVKISDRNHIAWDKAKAAIKKATE